MGLGPGARVVVAVHVQVVTHESEGGIDAIELLHHGESPTEELRECGDRRVVLDRRSSRSLEQSARRRCVFVHGADRI